MLVQTERWDRVEVVTMNTPLIAAVNGHPPAGGSAEKREPTWTT